MKKLMILAMMMVMTISAKAMPYERAKDEALFLSDKMAYELDLTDEQYEAVYEINLDYLLCLSVADDLLGSCWERRNADLCDVLSDWQYDKYLTIEYFYRPVIWRDEAWAFLVYDHYMRDVFYFTHPKAYLTYKGGHNLMHDHFYADRIANKPASPEHHHAPAAHADAPVTPNYARPAAPARPAGGMGPGGMRPGGMGPGGGAPMGGRR